MAWRADVVVEPCMRLIVIVGALEKAAADAARRERGFRIEGGFGARRSGRLFVSGRGSIAHVGVAGVCGLRSLHSIPRRFGLPEGGGRPFIRSRSIIASGAGAFGEA